MEKNEEIIEAIEGTEKIEIDVPEPKDEEAQVVFDINSYPADLTLGVIYDMWTKNEFVIPKYQRSYVWSIEQASLLIESFLLGLPVPPAFLYLNEESRHEVIDGQQRIRSVCMFIEGYFGDETKKETRSVFRLSGLNAKSPYYKKTFSDLPPDVQRRLKNSCVLRSILIKQLHPTTANPSSVYYIFERLNTGGTPLSPQEIRNCVYSGPFADSLRQLNENPSWRLLIGASKILSRERDVEFILRVFALSIYKKRFGYQKPMKEFLNSAMNKKRKTLLEESAEFHAAFLKATEYVATSLGGKPFNAWGRLNISLLDSVLCAVVNNLESLPKMDEFKIRYAHLVGIEDYRISVKYNTSDEKEVDKRLSIAKSVLIDGDRVEAKVEVKKIDQKEV